MAKYILSFLIEISFNLLADSSGQNTNHSILKSYEEFVNTIYPSQAFISE